MLAAPLTKPTHPAGRLVLFLHAHLPYVRHVDRTNALEEDWLFEAITDVYLPLCRNLDRWHRDQIPVRLTLSVSPTLVTMLKDRLLIQRYADRLDRLLALATDQIARTRDTPFAPLAERDLERLERTRDDFFERYDHDLLQALAGAQRRGQLELATTAATHAFLPNHAAYPELVRAQIRVAIRQHRRAFHAAPRGFWLPECGYAPGLDDALAAEGLDYFVLDTHGVARADPPPIFEHYAPVLCPSGVAAFPRDPASSAAVWSDVTGYPGGSAYRERHRDLGFDLDEEALDGLLLDDGRRRAVGLRYHRVTGRDVPLGAKEPYDLAAAAAAVQRDAEHFVEARIADARTVARTRDVSAVLVAPYDAELFGHWWYEGPEFLDAVVRAVARTDDLELATPSDVLEEGRFQLVCPAHSSWGHGGFGWTWLNESTDWILPRLHAAADRLAPHVAASAPPLADRALRQAARELLLASASDWPFLVTHDSVADYARARVEEHLARFDRLLTAVETDAVEEALLAAIEHADDVFGALALSDFSRGRT